MKEHFQPLAGNEVLKEFLLKLTPMSIALPLPRESITESKYDSRSRSVYFSTSDRSAFTIGIIPSTHQKRTTES